MDLKNVFDKSWKPALSVTLAVTVTTMWDMAAVPPMGQRVAVPPMGDRVAVPPMGDRVAVPPMGDRVALSPNLVVNEILHPGCQQPRQRHGHRPRLGGWHLPRKLHDSALRLCCKLTS